MAEWATKMKLDSYLSSWWMNAKVMVSSFWRPQSMRKEKITLKDLWKFAKMVSSRIFVIHHSGSSIWGSSKSVQMQSDRSNLNLFKILFKTCLNLIQESSIGRSTLKLLKCTTGLEKTKKPITISKKQFLIVQIAVNGSFGLLHHVSCNTRAIWTRHECVLSEVVWRLHWNNKV